MSEPFATSRITRNRPYFEAAFDETVEHRLKNRKYEKKLAIGALAVSLGLVIVRPGLVTAVPLLMAAWLMWSAFTYRDRVLSRSMSLPGYDQTMDFEFRDQAVKITGHRGSADLPYEAVQAFDVTPGGLFLSIEVGSSIFIPRESIRPAGADEEIVAAIQKAIETRP